MTNTENELLYRYFKSSNFKRCSPLQIKGIMESLRPNDYHMPISHVGKYVTYIEGRLT